MTYHYMLLIGVIISILLITILLVFTYFSNSPTTLTPEKSSEMIKSSQEALDKAEEKSKSEQNQIKNIDLP